MHSIHPLARRLGAASLLALAALASGPVAAADTWRAYTYNAVATVTAVKGLNGLLEAIQKETDGQLSVRLNLGGTLPIAATNITQAVGDNVVQVGDDAFFVGSVPVGGVVRLPMLLRTRADFEKAWSVEAPYLRAEYDKKGIVLLGRYIFPENVMWSTKKLGGIPVTLGTSEVAAGIDRGVIDGALTASSGYGYIWRDLLKYSYRLNVSFVDSLILVNKGA